MPQAGTSCRHSKNLTSQHDQGNDNSTMKNCPTEKNSKVYHYTWSVYAWTGTICTLFAIITSWLMLNNLYYQFCQGWRLALFCTSIGGADRSPLLAYKMYLHKLIQGIQCFITTSVYMFPCLSRANRVRNKCCLLNV